MQEYGVRYQDGEVGSRPLFEEDQDTLPANLEIRWRLDGRWYFLQSVAGAGGKVVISYERMLRPTLKRAVDCLGMPEAYWAWYGEGRHGGKLLSVLLLYPKYGTVVVAHHFGRLSLNANGNQLDLDVLRRVRVDDVVFLPQTQAKRCWIRHHSCRTGSARSPIPLVCRLHQTPEPDPRLRFEVSTLPAD